MEAAAIPGHVCFQPSRVYGNFNLGRDFSTPTEATCLHLTPEITLTWCDGRDQEAAIVRFPGECKHFASCTPAISWAGLRLPGQRKDCVRMRLDPPVSFVAALRLGGVATRAAPLAVPADHRRRRHAEPPRRNPAIHPLVNRGQRPRPQVHR